MHRRRKHGIKEAIENYPVIINIFDVLYIDGEATTSLPYIQRRKPKSHTKYRERDGRTDPTKYRKDNRGS